MRPRTGRFHIASFCGIIAQLPMVLQAMQRKLRKSEDYIQMKKIGTLLLVLLLALALTACDSIPKDSGGSGGDSDGGVYAEDGYGEGRLGSLMHTHFFDFTVNSAYTTTDYNGYTATQADYQLLVANITVKNTWNQSITMWDSDFQAQWSTSQDTGLYSWPVTDDGAVPTVSDDQLPAEYKLAVEDERTGDLVFEVPVEEEDFSISTLEIFDDGSEEGEEGDTFAVFFTATAQ